MEKDTVLFNGVQFVRYPNSRSKSARRYYYAFVDGKRAKGIGALHQEVWKAANGPIPRGYDIHHTDEDTLNNTLENLECITKKEHAARHSEAYRQQRQAWIEEIRPKAAEWHASAEGKEWHRQHGIKSWEGKDGIERACLQCGKTYLSRGARGDARFCSRSCINRWHHVNRTHYEDRACTVCGTSFNVKKSMKQQVCSRKCAWVVRRN